MSLAFTFLNKKKVKKGGQGSEKELSQLQFQEQALPPQPSSSDFKSLSDPSLNASCPSSDLRPTINPLSQSEHLPDVADNEAEREIVEKRRASGSVERVACDLVSQLEADEEKPEDIPEHDIYENDIYENDIYEDDPLENPEMISSFFDDNGNPVDEDEEKEMEIQAQAQALPNDDIPKYFINAATLSDEEFTPEIAASPLPDRKTSLPKPEPKPMKPNSERSGIPRSNRSRVPISKSFPDIIQTTILNSEEDTSEFKTKADFDVTDSESSHDVHPPRSSMMESLVADSLEEIAVARETRGPRLFERMNMDNIMTDSTVSVVGISGEKPPESWIVDFNSFSLEAELIEQAHRNVSRIPVATTDKSNPSSNSNSLAFFINMDEPVPDPQENAKPVNQTGSDQKKIFSMFVGIEKEEVKAGPSVPAQPVINKPLKSLSNSGEEPSMMMVKGKPCSAAVLGKKYPSPHFPHKSGDGMKKVNHQKDRIKTEYGREMCSSIGSGSDGHLGSNRSSLHVANYADGSFTASSLLSSMETSVPDEADVCQGGSCFKLGMDLLRMFQEGINTDVNISVRGRYVKAHKCILASRSQYFAAILSGNWIQKAGNTIYLDEFSYNVVQFTMYHIYSGTGEIPDSIDLIELASLTDLLGLEGLREVISQTIRQKFAHNFHRPCTGCISGVLEFFPLAINYGMDELHRKMTKWICKHFVRIWPTKAFATLGEDLIQKCLSYSVNHLSAENLLDITLGCDQLLSTMPSVRWTEAIFSVVNQLSAACVTFVGENISQVLQSQRFLLFGKGQTWNISRIENTFLEGILLLKPDEACLCHVALSRLIELGGVAIDEVEWSTNFVDFLKMLRGEVEKYLLANASRAVLSKNWEQLSQDVRKRICTTSFLGLDKSGNKIQHKTHHSQPHGSAVAIKNTRPASSTSARSGTRNSTKPAPAVVAAPAKKEQKLDLSPCTAETNSISSSTSTTHSVSETKSTKSVASVRPMPSTTVTAQVPQQNVYSSNKASAPSSRRPGPAKASAATPISSGNALPSQANNALRKRSIEKEKSFDTSSSRNTSAGSQGRNSSSSNRTAPITPITPSKPNAFHTKTFSNTGNNSRAPVPQAVPVTKPVFLTNSEKAKAVSKPPLICRGSRSNSISSEATISTHSRQSSLGSASVQTTPRTPNLSQNSRYAAPSVVVQKPKSNSEKTIKPPQSPLPKSRFTTGGFSTQTSNTSTSNVRTRGQETTGSKTSESRINRTMKAPVPDSARGKRVVSNITNFSPVPDHNLMTKSTYEMESASNQEEPKMRTLAEIGRSSTFSKDEPTILGKMDLSMEPGMMEPL